MYATGIPNIKCRLAGNVAIAVEEFKETKTNVERPKKI